MAHAKFERPNGKNTKSVKLDIFESAVWALKVDIDKKFYLT